LTVASGFGKTWTRAACLVAAAFLLSSACRAETAFITNQSSEDLSVVDLDTGKILHTTAIGGKPAGIAVGRQWGTPPQSVYVVSPDSKTVTVLDGTGRAIATRIKLPGGPLGIAVHPSGNPVYVADWYGARLWVVNPQAGLIGEIPAGDSPSGIAVTPDGTKVLSADRDSNQVTVADTETLAVLARVPVGIRPFGITIDPEGRHAYTADVGSNTVTVIDIATATALAQIPTGERPYAVALAGGKGFVTNQYADTVTVFDLASLAPIGRIDVGEYPEGIDISRDERSVIVANWFSNTLSVIDVDTLTVTREIEVGDGPRAFGRFVGD
jgi:YVTN family beta-propeller protein